MYKMTNTHLAKIKAAMDEAMAERRAFSYHFFGGNINTGWWAMNQGMARRIK
jgi:hypothetical protein